jgi:hypothetical protein
VLTDNARADFFARLRARMSEIESAIATRVYSISDPAEVSHPEYVQGLRASLSAAIEYGLSSLELGERRSPPPPPLLAAQARAAARNGIGLDIVLRRYLVGYALLVEFVIEEAHASGLGHDVGLRGLLRGQAALFDRLVDEVSQAFLREASEHVTSEKERRVARIKRLLSGESRDTSGLGYEFDAHHHIGAIAAGSEADVAIRQLAKLLDCHLLLVSPESEIVWAWLGSSQPLDTAKLEDLAHPGFPTAVSIALGECACGFAGWRFTHQQAVAALPIALDGNKQLIRYVNVALLASVLQDDLLAASLRKLYLEPLEDQRDGGEDLRQALRAYFATGRNVSSAAAMLGVSRPTVANRLTMVDTILNRPLSTVAVEMEVALRLDGSTSSLQLRNFSR